MKLGNFLSDREGRKALLLMVVFIGLIALIAKEMHKAKANEEKFSEITDYIVSLISEDRPAKVFDFDSKEITIDPSPILETDKFRYTISGVDRYKECSIIFDAFGRELRSQGRSAVIRISKGDLYPAAISRNWSVPEIDLFANRACDLIHRNKASILIDFH